MALSVGDIAKIDQRKAVVDEILNGVIACYVEHRDIGCCEPEQGLPSLAHLLKTEFEIDSLVDLLAVAVEHLADAKRSPDTGADADNSLTS